MIFCKNLGRVAALCILPICAAAAVEGQALSPSERSLSEHLVVPEGAPLRVILTGKVRFKRGEPVHARLVEPVYAFDREVLPENTEVIGHVTGFKSASRWVRVTSMAGGNFTPPREPQLTFDTLVLKDGKSIPI